MEDIAIRFRTCILSTGHAHHIPNKLFERILDEYVTSEQFEIDVKEEQIRSDDIRVVLDALVMNFFMDFPMRLFDKAVQKYGISLWNKKAWRCRYCFLRCPLGDFCGRCLDQIFTIDGVQYCIGQLYMNRYYRDDCKLGLPVFSEQELCRITNPFEKSYVFGQERISEVTRAWNFSLDYSYDMTNRIQRSSSYFPKYHRRRNRYIGGNVIPHL